MKKKILVILLGLVIFSTLAFIGASFYIFQKYSKNLPEYEQLKNYSPMITTRIYAADGSLVSEFSKEKRIFVPINNIPKNLINAFLAAEDANFYHHFGLDPKAILRTAVKNLIAVAKGKPLTGGASTITQQVVKNFLLTNERSYERKIREAILAYRMTKSFSKDHVLELYLNQIYLGSGSYGVAAAAQSYFSKSIDILTIEEVALLATLPKAPSKLDPRKNMVKAKVRRDWVIKRMMKENFITKEAGLEAINKPITLTKQEKHDATKAAFFSDSVKKELTGLYGSDNVFEDGITVLTTLKPDLQKIASKVFIKGIEAYDKKHGYRGSLGTINIKEDWKTELQSFKIKEAFNGNWTKAIVLSVNKFNAKIALNNGDKGLIHIDSLRWAKKYITINKQGPEITRVSHVLKAGDVILVEKEMPNTSTKITKKTSEIVEDRYLLQQIPKANGALLAMDPHSGRVLAMVGGYIDAPNQFNRATQAYRQPGSTMKTFGYITALENGMTPASVIMDEEISLDQGPGLPPYEPVNYSGKFYGPTTLRIGLEKSRNITTVRMADEVGIDKIVDIVKKFGINNDPKKIHSLVLGSTETNLMRLTTAYAMMVNGGMKVKPALIEKIQDREGKTIYRRDKRECINCIITEAPNANLEPFEGKDLEMPHLKEESERIIDSATAYQITSMLRGAVKRGTGYKATATKKIIGGKTGTTNNSNDSWFVGFSADLVAAVYIGFDAPRSLGARETGASVALPIFVDFMGQALADSPATPFRVPNTVKFVKINRFTGKMATPETPREHTIFEAFKLYDLVEKTDSNKMQNLQDGEEVNEFDTEFNSNPSGIY